MPGSPDDGVAVCAVCTVSLVAVSRTSGMARALSHGGDCGGLRCVHTMSRIASAANECPRWIRFGQGSRSGRWREVWPYELSGTTFFRAVESAEFETSVGGHACDPPLPCDQAPRGTRSVLWPESLCAWSSQRDPPVRGTHDGASQSKWTARGILRFLVPGLRLHAICDCTSTVSLH